MNSTKPNTGAEEAPAPKAAQRKLLDIADMISNVRHLNEAVLMAVGAISDRFQMNAIQSVNDEINNKLLTVEDRIEELREELA